jgi:phenylacetate-CoA ligase
MIRKAVFVLAHELGDPSFYPMYRKCRAAQWKAHDELRRDQEKQLRALVAYAYDQVPYYRRLFNDLHLRPKDIQIIEDLEKLPILTKDAIKANWDDFVPADLPRQRYDVRATGGSTGAPLQYRLSRHDRFLSAALLYRGWGYGGFELGDRMVFLAGTSLDTGSRPFLESRVHELTRNVRRLSSFDMADPEMRHYADVLNSFHPRFLRGYPSSIFFYARWLKENDVEVPALDAVFTTAEMLLPHMRETIGDVFRCQVYDNYGLNDGGLGAYECSEHSGLHIDTERSVMEVVDPDDHQVSEGDGAILATSLYNYAMPFIRYATGDAGTITDERCPCGRSSPILKGILGRQQEMLVTPDGTHVFGGFITHVFWNFPHVKEFQVVQKAPDTLIITIVPEPSFEEKELEEMRAMLDCQGKGWEIEFKLVDEIDRSRAGKHKYIINEMEGV